MLSFSFTLIQGHIDDMHVAKFGSTGGRAVERVLLCYYTLSHYRHSTGAVYTSTATNWSILKTPVTALQENAVFTVNSNCELTNNLPQYWLHVGYSIKPQTATGPKVQYG